MFRYIKQKNKNDWNKGFTLVETLVAISIFTMSVLSLLVILGQGIANSEYAKQLIRSSGSQAANYIEANESLSRKDFFHRIKISRKEAKESCYWLKLTEPSGDLLRERDRLIQESIELTKIFGAIWEQGRNKKL